MTSSRPRRRRSAPGSSSAPVGGYALLATGHEGVQIAQWFNLLGISAFVLKYPLRPRYHRPVEFGDAQQAMRIVRSRSKEFGIAPNRLGIRAATSPPPCLPTSTSKPVPDFAILAYPVITMRELFTHRGSRENRLGDHPTEELANLLSNKTQVTAQTPPTFPFQTTDDDVVSVENSIMFYEALRKAGVPARIHMFEHGPHGTGLAAQHASISLWPTLLAKWLRGRGLPRQEAWSRGCVERCVTNNPKHLSSSHRWRNARRHTCARPRPTIETPPPARHHEF